MKQIPSNRSFGWLFAAVFSLVGTYSLWHEGWLYPWAFGLAAMTAAVTMFRPESLTSFNRVWMQFGELLHRVVSPLMLGIVFYGVFAPIGIVMRMFGRDVMNRRFEPGAKTYWISRDPPGPPGDSLRDQF